MTIFKEYLKAICGFMLLALFSLSNSFFPIDANAGENEAGGIVVGRDVQGSAIRPPLAPGKATVVNASPVEAVRNELGAEKMNNKVPSFKELNEKDFATITTDAPFQQINSENNINGVDRNNPAQFFGANLGSNVTQSTSGISGNLVGSTGAITNSVTSATSSIGQAISGVTGFMK